jgi:D-alanyl-lipoteichoic acid acyltransferase DltB (MBOAT superfamily)
MTIAGLWHGPSWTFVIFGLLHGAALTVNHVWRKKIKIRIPDSFAWIATLVFLNVSFIFFRSPSVSVAVGMLRAMIPHPGFLSSAVFHAEIRRSEAEVIAIPLLVGFLTAAWGPDSDTLKNRLQPNLASLFVVSALLLLSILFMNSNVAKEFVYFAF